MTGGHELMGQRHRTYTLPDGSILGDVIGADADENENTDEEQDEDEDEEDQGAGGDQDDQDSDEDDSPSDDAKKSKTDLIAERDAALKAKRAAERRMRRADRAKSHAESELNALKDGGDNELATARDRITKLEAQLAERDGADTTSLIREEFRDLDDVDWHNRKLAFSLLPLDEVDVEDGEVDPESLRDAVEKLKAAHPYLVKAAPTSEKDDEQDGEEAKRPPRSGDPMRRRKDKEQTSAKQLESKFPVIAGRF